MQKLRLSGATADEFPAEELPDRISEDVCVRVKDASGLGCR